MDAKTVTFSIVSVAAIIVFSASVFGGMLFTPDEDRIQLTDIIDYAPSIVPGHDSYVVDGSSLYVGKPSQWRRVWTPRGVAVNTVAIDPRQPSTIYIGAADSIVLYRSIDSGKNWTEVPLSGEAGAVTDIAVDGVQRLIYAATDTGRVYRLRDVGSSVILSGQLVVDEPVLQVVADTSGGGLAFARTQWALYRADNYGLRWYEVTNLHSAPTALAIAGTNHATVFVGTVDRGILTSQDGENWTLTNDGLGFAPGSRLHVDALATDPAQPEVLYASVSFLHGSSTTHQTPASVVHTADSGDQWQTIETDLSYSSIDLAPVTGHTGAVFAVTELNRTLTALGSTQVEEYAASDQTADQYLNREANASSTSDMAIWLLAGLAAMALLLAAADDLQSSLPIYRNRPATS